MNKEILKFNRRQKRRARSKGEILGTKSRPRLVVYKSISSIYNKNPFYLVENKFSFDEIKKYFLNNKIDIIPIVNSKKKISKNYKLG